MTNPIVLKNWLLHDIEKRLLNYGRRLTSYGLPEVDPWVGHNLDEDEDVCLEEPSDVEALQASLTSTQKLFANKVFDSIEASKQLLLFLDAPGGTGKTYTLNVILKALRVKGYSAVAVATSALAATLLEGGKTAHSAFRIPLNAGDDATSWITAQSREADYLRRCNLVVWDEAPMAHKNLVKCVDRLLRDLAPDEQKHHFFGGKTIIFGGDFRQLLPVIARGSPRQVMGACLKQSEFWPHLELFQFQENMRLRGAVSGNSPSTSYATWLLSLGTGALQEEDCADVQIWPPLIVTPNVSSLCSWVFEGLGSNYQDAKWMTSRVVLAPHNSTILTVNNHMSALFPGVGWMCTSADMPEDSLQGDVQVEYLNTLEMSGMPPHKLLLKKHMPILLLRNINPGEGLCNGTRLVVESVASNGFILVARNPINDKLVYIPRTTTQPTDVTRVGFLWTRRQFPITPAFGMSIHKSQGQTITGRVGVMLDNVVFEHGQLYVAASRVTCPSNIRFAIADVQSNSTRNIVYRSLLRGIT